MVAGKWRMALSCYASARTGGGAFASLLYDSGRSNSSPRG